MVTWIVLSAAIVAQPLPTQVMQAEGFALPAATPRKPTIGPPSPLLLTIAGRDPRKIKEWRDINQAYAIFWTRKSGRYRAFKIEGPKYVPIKFEGEPDFPQLHLTLEDAYNQVERHWRIAAGKKPVHYHPSPKLKDKLKAMGKLDDWDGTGNY